MAALDEQLANLGIDNCSTQHVEVHSVALNENAATGDFFDRVKAQLANKKKKDRQIWLGRPPIEQGPCGHSPELKLITLKEVATKVNHIWIDRVLFVQATRSPFQQSTGLFTLLKDDSRTMVTLSLWNFLPLNSKDEFASANLESELPKDTYLALLNPLLVPNKLWEESSKEPVMLRCDNPQCVRIFFSKEEWEHAKVNKSFADNFSPTKEQQTAALLKDQGNAAFGKEDYVLAIRYYRHALAIATARQPLQNDIAVSCLGNLAEACLQSGKYEAAEGYARRILSDYDPNHFKAQFRLARALLPQNKPEQAKDMLMQLRTEHPSNAASLQPILGDCLQAIMEKRGKYNIKKMLGEATLSPILPFHAGYTSSQIYLGVSVVRPSDGETYRGVLAKEDIPEGTLLTVSKAFAFAYQHGNLESSIRKKHLYEVSHVHQAVLSLRDNLGLGASFYCLEAGGEVPESSNTVATQDHIDLPKIRSILGSNRFGVDLNSPESPFTLKSPSTEADEDQYVGVGLWLDVSMYNHSCTPNSVWAQIGNYMFVHTCKDVKQGDELCIGYVHPALSFLDRKARFQKWSGGKGFECGCEWCHWMRTSPSQFQEMNEEVKRAQMRMGSGEALESMDQLISASRRAQIRDAHKDVPEKFQHTVYNLSMIEALQCASDGDRRGTLEAAKAATKLGYAIRGGLRQETRVQDLCCLAAAHMTCDEDSHAQLALEELLKHQTVLPSLTEFQNMVLMSSMQIWSAYQAEPFMQRWALINKNVWEQRSKQLK